MNLESPKVTLNKSAQNAFDFLSNVKNFEQLMPENISKFEVLGQDTFVFALKGMPEIELKKKEVKIMLLEKELSDAIEIVSKVAKHS